MTHMILSQGEVAGGLADELLEVIHKYDNTLYTSTVIGVIELIKHQLIGEAMWGEKGDDDD